MPVGVGVGEESTLEHLIEGGLYAGDQMSRRVGNLLSLGEVVLRALVEDQLSDRNEGVITMRDDLSHIKDIPLVVEAVLLRNDLHAHGPLGSLAGVKVVHQISSSIVGVDHQIVGLLG